MIVRFLLVAVTPLTGAVVAVCPASQGQELPTPLRINELMASNGKTISDPQGEYDDWVELYNAGQQAINVAGMYLTNDLGAPTKWQFPADQPAVTTVQPHGYLLLWADGDTGDWGLHASFRLDAEGDTVAVYDSDGQTLIDVVQFRQQTPDVSWGRDPNDEGQWRALGLATPGGQNVNFYLGFVADVKFSCERGFCEQPFSVTLTTATEGAVIYYTTDGSSPFNDARAQPTGRLYTGPVPITTTTCLRVVAFKPRWKASRVGTQTYIFLDDVIRQPARPPGWPTAWGHTGSGDYEMDPRVVNDPRYSATIKDDLKSVATLSLVTDRNNWFGPNGQGIYLQGELVERPVSAELIFPDEREGFQIDCAVMIVGGTSPDRWKMDKLSMRLKFKGEYGPASLQFPMFGDEATDHFDTVVLDAGMNNMWAYGGDVSPTDQRRRGQYTHDQFVCDIQNAMGGYAPHGRHVHLYLNGLYWGLYWVHERPDEHFASAYLGGSDEDYDVLKHNSGSVINGSGSNYNEMFSVANAGLASDAQYATIQQYLDVPNFIDYMITNYYIGNTDWAHQNWYATRNRVDPAGRWRYHTWDAEHVMETLDEDCTGKDDSGGPTHLHRRLAEDAEYRLLFADHIYGHLFNDGILTPAGAAALYQIRLDEVDRAVVGESARWGDNQETTPRTRDVDWVRERDSLLNTYFPQRTGIVLNQFKSRGWYPNVDPPAFRVDGAARHGGGLTGGESLSMAAAAGTIWYTLDGNDPRVPGSAPPATEVTLISENAAKRVLVPTGPFNDAWRGGAVFDDSGWISGAGGVGYERSTGYESFFRINVGDAMYGKNTSCYIRIPFVLTRAGVQNISKLTLRVRYDDGFVACLNGTEVQRALADGTPTWNSGASGSHLDSDAIVFEDFDISGYLNALREGDNLLAIQALNQGTTSSDFLLSVELTATPKGGSSNPSGVAPTAIQYASPATLTKSIWVKARVLSGTTWSALNEAVFAVGPVAESLRISEIMYHPADTGNPDDPNTEFIELTNIGSAKINLNLVRFSNGVDFTFPSFDLAPGAYRLVVKDTAAFIAKYGSGLPVVGQYSGSLSNAGERIELLDAAGAVIHDFHYEDNWFDITDGLGFSLTARSPKTTDPNSYGSKGAWRPSAHAGGSPGTDDSGQVPVLGSVVINELLVKDVAMFSSKYTAPAGVKVLAWGIGNLADGGEKIELSKPADPDGKGNPTWIRVDRVVYSDGSHPGDFPEGVDPWPVQPDGKGSSLSRTTKAAYGNDPANWHAPQSSPGSANP